MNRSPGIALVTRKTRLQGLLERWGTRGQARFRLAQAHVLEQERQRAAHGRAAHKARSNTVSHEQVAAEFEEYEREDAVYRAVLEKLQRELDFGVPVQMVDREFLPTFDFRNCQLVVVAGQDGLVANAAKYVGDLPVVGVNPDPSRFDGILLPFEAAQARAAVGRTMDGKTSMKQVTLAEVVLNDGQRMLAFNDFFVGRATHVSARYTLKVDETAEPQSSSGLLVSTGAGSTGWLSSVFNMADGIAAFRGGEPRGRVQLDWEDRHLIWAVREPFVSRHSSANLVAGMLDEGRELVVESLMPASGVIFSDGVEQDYLEFNSGVIARVFASQQRAHLVVA
jgi:hypothetical protein